jgi:hypothetical protein
MNRIKGFSKVVFLGIGIFAVLAGGFLALNVFHRPITYHFYTFAPSHTKLPPCPSDHPLSVHSANPCQRETPSFSH